MSDAPADENNAAALEAALADAAPTPAPAAAEPAPASVMPAEPAAPAVEEVKPGWVTEFEEKFTGGLAHAFILHGAVEDYVGASRTRLTDYLSDIMHRRCAVLYNVASGINFLTASDRKRFLEAVGIDLDKAPDPHEPFYPEALKALPVLEKAMLSPDLKGQMLLIFEYPELIWPPSDYGHLGERDRINLATLRRWATNSKFIAAEQIIFLITPATGELQTSLRSTSSMIEPIEIPYPSLEERAAFIDQRLAEDEGITLADGLTPQSFAALTGGLPRISVDDICLRASLADIPVDLSLIKERKDQIIRNEYGDVIEILEPRHGFKDVGGMAEIKDYLNRSVIAPLRGQTSRDRMPSGVMLAGPPGTGKTWLVSALAHEAGVNVVKLNVGRLMGSYVGMSERNLEKALACIRSLAPTLVMIDEIEQQFQRGGQGDGGVERRIFGRILEEMSGSSGTQRGDVVWFAATNRVDNVDPALRRPGRFDRIVPILPPTPAERWAILLAKFPPGTHIESNEQAGQIAMASDAYTGADLDGVMIKAIELAYDAGLQAPTGQTILQALSLLRPSSSGDEVKRMTDVALEHCNDLSLVPADWRQRAMDVQAAAAQH